MSRNRNKNKDKRSDNIKVSGQLNDVKFKQNPNWYFKDAVQADILSRIQMNAFGAITKIGGNIQPTVLAMYANPCPGVTWFDENGSSLVQLDGNLDSNSKGINRAAQKLWYILTAKSGRAAGYTKADVALLLLGMGAMIETYEFIRRAFGIAYTYNQRNRALPNMLYKAMCIDMQDYQANAAPYLKRMNSLMAIMNQLPMPGNVAWFAKCQDIYQQIYMDYPSEMAQLFIVSPSTTWVVEEDDGFIGGSYLRTVDMCVKHREADATSPITIGVNTSNTNVNKTSGYICPDRTNGVRIRHLGDYIDVFEEQINKLLFSSTFSTIYSDLLRAFDNGTLSRWTFDYIDEKYNIAPVFDDNRLWMFHNSTLFGGQMGLDRTTWQGKWSVTPPNTYEDVFKYGTPANDVYQWANTDVVVYNPTVYKRCTIYNGSERYVDNFDYVADFPNDAPTTEERIEYTRYMAMGYDKYIKAPVVDDTSVVCANYCYNLNLPDHWFEMAEILSGESDTPVMVVDQQFFPRNFNNIYTVPASANDSFKWTKFHHFKLFRHGSDNNVATPSIYEQGDVMGELNAWTFMDKEWFKGINDMVYVDLFDIR